MTAWPSTKAGRALAALYRIGWPLKRQSGSHKTLSRPGWPDVVFAFHDNESIVHFIRTNAARSVVIADHIIGCPHEEGTDYPLGEKCPRCPFWATRDRWSGEMIQ